MLALSRFRNTLLGAVAAAAVISSIIAPAASAAVLPVSAAPAPVLQGGSGGLHPISVRLLSVYVHDDGDGFGQGAGEIEDHYTFIEVAGGSGSGTRFHLDNGAGWAQMFNPTFGVDRTQEYASDHNYPMSQNITGVNKYFGAASVGSTLSLYSEFSEHDQTGNFYNSDAVATIKVTVPAVGKEKIVSYDVESFLSDHIRATFTIRIATAA